MSLKRSDDFKNFDAASSTEFVTVSNSGAYSSSTICGANTRRYHALLAAPLDDPAGIFIYLSSVEEILSIGGARFYLSTSEYPGAIFPQGFKHIKAFEMDPLPTFVFEVEGVTIRKRIGMAPDEATVVVSYELCTDRQGVTVEIRPLAAYRQRHYLTHANPDANLEARREKDWVLFQPYKGLPVLKMKFPGEFVSTPAWYKQIVYRRDRERGHEAIEDLHSPGLFRGPLMANTTSYFVATVEKNIGAGQALMAAAEARAHEWSAGTRRLPHLTKKLAVGMRDFVVKRGASMGVLRGLPWHTEWARHAMMALPGLTAMGKVVEAQEILQTWASRATDGMLPLYIDETSRPYGADAEGSLWLFEAAANYLDWTKNYEWVRQTLGPFMHVCLERIMTRQSPSAQLGDNGLVYTPSSSRILAPKSEGLYALVEIQALYFNALKVAEEVAQHFRDGELARHYNLAAKDIHRAYNKLMWDSVHHVPIDSLGEKADLTTRPMCLLSVALSHPILVRRRWELLLDQVETALLTPRGLLAVPVDYPGSKKFFPGDSFEDARIHGGVWPEFLGAFLAAHTKTFGRTDERTAAVNEYLHPLEKMIPLGMLYHLPEFFDSAEPFTPRGAPANAAASGQLIWAFHTKVQPRHYGGEGS